MAPSTSPPGSVPKLSLVRCWSVLAVAIIGGTLLREGLASEFAGSSAEDGDPSSGRSSPSPPGSASSPIAASPTDTAPASFPTDAEAALLEEFSVDTAACVRADADEIPTAPHPQLPEFYRPSVEAECGAPSRATRTSTSSGPLHPSARSRWRADRRWPMRSCYLLPGAARLCGAPVRHKRRPWRHGSLATRAAGCSATPPVSRRSCYGHIEIQTCSEWARAQTSVNCLHGGATTADLGRIRRARWYQPAGDSIRRRRSRPPLGLKASTKTNSAVSTSTMLAPLATSSQ